jgi:hypothetical protein
VFGLVPFSPNTWACENETFMFGIVRCTEEENFIKIESINELLTNSEINACACMFNLAALQESNNKLHTLLSRLNQASRPQFTICRQHEAQFWA